MSMRRRAVLAAAILLSWPAIAASPTTIQLTSSQNPSIAGDPVTFTAVVASPDGWPTGDVEIFRGPDSSGPIALDPQGVLVDASGEAQMVIGLQHSCAVTRAGAVRCWGDNDFGQLGDGTTEDRPEGVTVQGLGSGAVAVAVGTRSSCALTAAGQVLCWGDNDLNQLGDNTTNDSLVPIQPQGLDSGVVDLFSSEVDVCALKGDGDLFCWGFGNEGLLGNGTKGRVPVPTKVSDLPAVRYLPPSIHDAFTLCVVTATDTVFCWGRNNVGQVGNGTDGAQELSPVQATITGVDTVAVGNAHTCALKKDGSVACWGWNDFGQVGEGTPTTIKSTPVTVTALGEDDIASVVVGGIHSCVVLTNGTAKCWGSNVGFALGAEGDEADIVPAPGAVTVVPSGIVALVGGEYATAAVKSGGRLYAWGTDTEARLGDGGTDTLSKPVVVKPMLAPSLASITLTDLRRGVTNMSSLYAGTPEFDGVGGGTVKQTVTGLTTTLLLRDNRVDPGDTFERGSIVQLRGIASVPGGSYIPTGTVTFKKGATVLGTAALDIDGEAVLPLDDLPVGESIIVASYDGDDKAIPATSTARSVVITRSTAGIAFPKPPSTVRPGATVTFSVTASDPLDIAAPTGSMRLSSNGVTLRTATLANGKATLVSPPLRTGSIKLRLDYLPTPDWGAPAPSVVTIAVSARIGSEARVNGRTTGIQQAPAVAGLGGPFVIAWESAGQDGSGFGIYGRRYRSDGSSAAREFRVNAVTARAQTRPALAPLKAGRWVAVWDSAGEDGSGAGLFARLYRADGTAGTPFRVNRLTPGNQRAPAVAALKDGGFVVAFTTDAPAKPELAVVVRRFDAAGRSQSSDLRVDSLSTGFAQTPAVAGLTDGGFVVVWRQTDAAQAVSSIRAQRFLATGAKAGSVITVNAERSRAKRTPDVAALAGGQWVAAWTSDGQDGSGDGVYGQRFAAKTGAKLGAEFRISSTARGEQNQPALGAFTGGGFVAAWTSSGQDGSGSGVFLRRYDAAGKPADGALRGNTVTAGSQDEPDVATLGRRDFVATWTSEGQDGSAGGIYVQRFRLGIDADKPLP